MKTVLLRFKYSINTLKIQVTTVKMVENYRLERSENVGLYHCQAIVELYRESHLSAKQEAYLL